MMHSWCYRRLSRWLQQPRQTRQPGLELKIPPVIVGLVSAALMGLVSWALPGFGFALPGHGFLAASLATVGVLTSVAGVVAFKKARTTVNPLQPEAASALVVSGIYQRTRNPMYLGFLLLSIGWALALSNALAFLLVPLFIFYMNRFQIEPEEAALTTVFGPEFASYQAKVRRWC